MWSVIDVLKLVRVRRGGILPLSSQIRNLVNTPNLLTYVYFFVNQDLDCVLS